MEKKCLVPLFLCREHCEKHCYTIYGELIVDHEFLCSEQNSEEEYIPVKNRGISYES
jgi:hypothetical protein